MAETAKIYEAVAKIMEDINAIGKEKKNQMQGFMYRGIDDVMNELHPLFAKYHVFLVPEALDHIREDRTNSKGNTLIYTLLKMRYTLCAEDGSNVSSVVYGEGMDSGDKSTNKAMAIAMKYAMCQLFCIPTEDLDDPDEDSPVVGNKSANKNNELEKLREELIEVATKKINEDKIPQDAVYQVIKDLNNGQRNPNSIKSVSVMKKVLAAIKEMKVEK